MRGGRTYEAARLRVSHVADSYRRYPGETVTLYTRVEVGRALSRFRLRVTVPPGLVAGDCQAIDQPGVTVPITTRDGGANHLIWDVERGPGATTRYEYCVEARVEPTQEDRRLESRAVLSSQADGEEQIRDEETATVTVLAKGRYLDQLPAIYRDDELMGRFLMLFESFWAPIEQQIEHLALYLDPRLTPAEFLPWLASWIDLVLDEAWPEDRRRQLLRSATDLYRKRGTCQGLREYLEIYTEGKATIVEHRAHNLRLGPDARLGSGVALGTRNMPHTFSVSLRLPPIASRGAGEERDRQEAARQRKILAIIEAEKPAHTAYDLHLEVEPEPG
jgi:phage tail-like protein